ncbi:hypothetical protein KIMH_00640 [Bombiscardovia apis]|uniref:Schlafen AlbA-2 domain-containing protein n=1 Tax=Bombiscardovia apis TaxID=2932182 RepID=A0ABN6SEL9_9BIFI|nr:ATP-binding protein [Bombiscardovia apis]BDR53953.1 hypothetical protein KIMH_00640 [Bombiscardovia apis]
MSVEETVGTNSLEDLVRQIQRKQCEDQTVEVKAAGQGTPKVYDSLSSFSNQNEGGFIVFGLDERLAFAVTGVFDAQKLQKAITDQGKEMCPEVRPKFSSSKVEGKTVVCAYVEGRPMSERPVYRETMGVMRGSYTRVGDADTHMTPTELYEIESFKDGRRDDVAVDPQAEVGMLAANRIADFLQRAQDDRPLLARRAENEILNLTGVTRQGRPTLAGLMALGDYPQQVYPNLCITAVAVAGTSLSSGEEGERFLDSKRFEGSVERMVEDAMAFVRRNSRTKTLIQDGVRTDVPEYPETAVREILTNALMHRDYGPYCNGTPVRLVLFADRLECWNPGGVYGGQSVNDLGFANSQTRNPTLVSLLEIQRVAENRHSGIPVIREEAEARGYRPVEFVDRQASFTVRFYHTPAQSPVSIDAAREPLPIENSGQPAGVPVLDLPERQSKYAIILDACRTPQTLEDIAALLGIGKYYASRRYVKPMVRDGLLTAAKGSYSDKKRRFVATVAQD